jgi:hypothetical protein
MNLPSQPGLRRRLVYGNNANRINMSSIFLEQSNISNRISDRINGIFDLGDRINGIFDLDEENDITQIHRNRKKISTCSITILLNTTRLIVNKKQQTCSICIDNMNIDSILRILPCNHYFHHTCIDQWLTTNINCPLCRTNLI